MTETKPDILGRLRATKWDKDNFPRLPQEKWLPVGLALEAADEIELLKQEISVLSAVCQLQGCQYKVEAGWIPHAKKYVALIARQSHEIDRLRTECAKLVDENNRLQEWKDAATAQAEDRDEYVLAQINREQADEIERLRSEKLYHLSQIERAIEIERERCAKIVESREMWSELRFKNIGQCMTAIAAAIRRKDD